MQFVVEAGVFPKICVIDNREERRMLDSDASLMLAFQSGDIFSFEKLVKGTRKRLSILSINSLAKETRQKIWPSRSS